ncbi:MAG: hypothetical protein ACHREM_04495 [Polyangiales bacterium]
MSAVTHGAVDRSGPLPQFNLEEASVVARLAAQGRAPRLSYPEPRIVSTTDGARVVATPDSSSPATSTLEVRFFDAAAAVAALEEVDEEELAPEPPKLASTTREKIGLFALVYASGLALLVVGAAVVMRPHTTTPTVAILTSSSARSEKRTEPSAAAAVVEEKPAPKPAPTLAPTLGMVVLPTSVHGQTIVVDDNLNGRAQPTLSLRCGRHDIRFGARGKRQSVDVPCGGTVTLSR